jgi:stage II sporulation protein AA (anti-sigma F factor antagonist)
MKKEELHDLAHQDLRARPGMSPAAGDFSAKVVGLDGDATVFLTGELDMATAPELTGVLGHIIAHGPQEVVLDFSGLSFIDSSGIAALVDAQHRLSDQERRLSIHGAQQGAVRVFEIAGLVDFLHVHIPPVEDPFTET